MSDEKHPPIPPELLAFAASKGFPRLDGESDEDYIGRLRRMQGHIALTVRAARYGAEIQAGMTSREVRAATNHRLHELLSDHGVRQGRQVAYRDRLYQVRKIYETKGTWQNPTEVRVQLWAIEWSKEDNRGRTIYVTAVDLLRSQGAPETQYYPRLL